MKRTAFTPALVLALLISATAPLQLVNLARANPIISIWSPEHRTYALYGPTLDIPLTFAVNEPVSWIGYSLDQHASVTITGNTTLTGLTKGSHSLVIYASDTAGNSYASDWVYFTVGDIPNVYLISPKNLTYESNLITISIEAGALTGPLWIAYSMDGGAPIFIANTSSPGVHRVEANTTVSLPNGSHSIVASTCAWFTGEVSTSYVVYFTIASSTSPSPSPSPTPSPSQAPSPSASLQPAPSPREPFPVVPVVAASVVVAVVAASSLLIYLEKLRRERTRRIGKLGLLKSR